MLLSAAAVSLAACGHKTDSTTTTDTSVTTNSTDTSMAAGNSDAMGNTAAPAASAAQTFVNAAAASDAFEIATSKLALDTSKSASIKKFANAMIKAHTESTDKLKGIVAGLTPSLTPDPTLTPDQQSTLDGLKSKTGSDFDSAYASAQVAAHTATLAAVKAYGANGDVPQLKDFANGLVPVVTAHLNMANGLK
jgi:putative membrane protein